MASSKNAKKIKKGGEEKEVLSFTAHTLLGAVTFPGKKHTLYSVLDDMGEIYGHIKRTLFKDCIRTGLKAVEFKNAYLLRYGITARQFNAIRYDLDGNISSATEVLKLRIVNLEEKIKGVKKWLKSKEAKIKRNHFNINISASERGRQLQKTKAAIHQKKRKLHALSLKLASLQSDLEQGRVRICFGSKTLFHKQFNLNENEYIFHDDWLSDWKKARSSQAFCLGSKDETGGNQSCTLSADGTLRIRVPNHLVKKYGKYVVVPGVKYPHGQDVIDAALADGQALTHRLVRGEKGWYLHTTVDIVKPSQVTFEPRDIGCIGVDVNEDEIAVSETDRFGNRIWSATYPSCVKDKNSDQTMAIYGDISALIVNRAVKTGKPIGHETLDFRKKKASLKEQGVSYARMLSQFAYSTFLCILERGAFRAGAQVFSVNPAYTSVIGRLNYMTRYGITPHEAAALAIARRVQKYSESPVYDRNASPLPARNRREHVWKYWHRQKDRGRGCGSKRKPSLRRPIQGSTCCAEPQSKSSYGTTAQTSRPPTSPSAGRRECSP